MNAIKIGLIGGSGLGQLLGAGEGRRHEIETPFGRPSDGILETEMEGLGVLLLSRHGAGHLLNPSQVPFRANIFALKQLGCTHIIASGAVGSLRQEFKPRDLVIPEQVIDKTFRRAGTFYDRAAVHVEFAEPFCPVLRRILSEEGKGLAAAAESKTGEGSLPAPSATEAKPFAVHDRGCYVCMEGPAFSSRAESLMHRLWGGDLIGMTALPEAKLAKEAEIPYALVALVTDYDAWRQKPALVPNQPPNAPKPAGEGTAQAGSTSSPQAVQGAGSPAGAPPVAPPPHQPSPEELLQEIIGNLQAASSNAMTLIRRTLRRIASDPAPLDACPAQNALKLAIWSEKTRIPAEEIERLRPLWGRYFE